MTEATKPWLRGAIAWVSRLEPIVTLPVDRQMIGEIKAFLENQLAIRERTGRPKIYESDQERWAAHNLRRKLEREK